MNKRVLTSGIVIVFFSVLLTGCSEHRTTIVDTNDGNNIEQEYTSFFLNVTIDDVNEMMANNSNLILVDCRTKPIYERGWIPNAICITEPEDLYNTTSDVLVYSQNGGFSYIFCKNLINHTFGALYNLHGGYQAWRDAGYPIETAFTTQVENITAEEAQPIITTTSNLRIIDCRSCDCRIQTMIPNATWVTNPELFYYTTDDLLIYSDDEQESIRFCNQLVSNIYGTIYHLQGGIYAWIQAGYDVITIQP